MHRIHMFRIYFCLGIFALGQSDRGQKYLFIYLEIWILTKNVASMKYISFSIRRCAFLIAFYFTNLKGLLIWMTWINLCPTFSKHRNEKRCLIQSHASIHFQSSNFSEDNITCVDILDLLIFFWIYSNLWNFRLCKSDRAQVKFHFETTELIAVNGRNWVILLMVICLNNIMFVKNRFGDRHPHYNGSDLRLMT